MAVASFDCPTGPSDVVENHANGLLVAPKDVDGLAAALGQLMGDTALRRRCGEAAVETARRYRMDIVGPEWDALLRSLALAGAGRREQATPGEPATAPASAR